MLVTLLLACALGVYLSWQAGCGIFRDTASKLAEFCSFFFWLIWPYTAMIILITSDELLRRFGLQEQFNWFWNHL